MTTPETEALIRDAYQRGFADCRARAVLFCQDVVAEFPNLTKESLAANGCVVAAQHIAQAIEQMESGNAD